MHTRISFGKELKERVLETVKKYVEEKEKELEEI